MENSNEILNKEEELYLALSYARLLEDVRIINDNMEEKAPKDYSEETNAFKREWGKNIVNPVKRAIVRDLSGSKKKALDNLEAFESIYSKAYQMEEFELKEMISDCFKDDKNQEARYMMALRVCLTEDYKFINAEESMKHISLLLFGDEDKAWKLYQSLKDNYFKISKRDLRNIEKGVLVGLGIATAATLIAGPIGLSIAAATSTGVAEALGAVAAAGAGAYGAGIAKVTVALVASEILLTGATCGVFTAIEIRKNQELKKQFREIDSDSLALRLAVKATLIEELIQVLPKEDTNAYLDDALQVLDNYRSDAEYMMIVEKLDAKEAKKKISICNNLSLRLAEIVGI